MTDIYWHNRTGNNQFNDARNYTTLQDGTGSARAVPINITAVNTAPAVGSQTITIATNISTQLRPVPLRMQLMNNVGLGVDLVLTATSVASTVYTIAEDITGIDVSGTLTRIDVGILDSLFFSGTGVGSDHDVIIQSENEFPYNDQCQKVVMRGDSYSGRVRAYESGSRKCYMVETTGDSYFTLDRGIDRSFAGKINYAAGWMWTTRLSTSADFIFGPEATSPIVTSLDSPYMIPDLGNQSTNQLRIQRVNTAVNIYIKCISDKVQIDTVNDNINLDGIDFVILDPLGVEYLNGTTGQLITSNGGTINVGPFQDVYASTNTVDADTLPTDKNELWLPPVYFVHDWNGGYQITESFETHIRTAQNGTETRREIMDKPYRNVVQASQGWTSSELLLMQALFNRMGSARTLIPIWSDMVHTLQNVSPTTPPYDSARYPVILGAPANGTSFPIDPSREDLRWRRFYKGMRVLVYDVTKQPSTRMVSVFEIAIISRVWGEYDYDYPNTYGTIWLTAPLTQTYQAGTRFVPLMETQITLDNESRLANAKVARFPIRMLEDVGRVALPSIVPNNVINDSNYNAQFVNPPYATVPSWYGSVVAPAAPVLIPSIANWATTPSRKFNRPGQFTKVGRGTIPEIYGSRILNEYQLLNTSLTREQAWAIITMFHSRSGRLNLVYIINPYEDYSATVLTAVEITIQKGAETVDIITRPFIAMKLASDGEWYIRRIVNLIDNGTTLTLQWIEPLPDSGVDVSDLACVRSAFLARFKRDDLIQNLITHNVMEVTIGFQDVGSETREDLSGVLGQWEINQAFGTNGIEIVRDAGSFTTTIDTQNVDSGSYYGTIEDAVRNLVDVELDTDSTCTPTSIFWPVDEQFEYFRIIYSYINLDGTAPSFVDIGYGERAGCVDYNYDFYDFVLRVYLTNLGALWNHRDNATETADIPCPRPWPKDFTMFLSASDYQEIPVDNFNNNGSATLENLVNGAVMSQFVNVTSPDAGAITPNAILPDGAGLFFSHWTRNSTGTYGNSRFQTSTKLGNEFWSMGGYACAQAFWGASGSGIAVYILGQGTTSSNGVNVQLALDDIPFIQNLNVRQLMVSGLKTVTVAIPESLKNRPFHWFATCSDVRLAVFINGVLAGETLYASTTVNNVNGTALCYGGSTLTKATQVKDFYGVLGNLIRYPYAVTDEEVEAIYLHFSYQNTQEDQGAFADFWTTQAPGGNTAMVQNVSKVIDFNAAGVSVPSGYGFSSCTYFNESRKQVQWKFSGDVSAFRIGWGNQNYEASTTIGVSLFGSTIALNLSNGSIYFKGVAIFALRAGPILAGDVVDIAIDPATQYIYFRLNNGAVYTFTTSWPSTLTDTRWLTPCFGTLDPPTTGLLHYEVNPAKMDYPPILAFTKIIPSAGGN